MKKSECLIRGYEIGKNTRTHGDIKLAQEVAKVSEEEPESIKLLCLNCIHGKINNCNYHTQNTAYPSCVFEMIGSSNNVIKCDQFTPKKQ